MREKTRSLSKYDADPWQWLCFGLAWTSYVYLLIVWLWQSSNMAPGFNQWIIHHHHSWWEYTFRGILVISTLRLVLGRVKDAQTFWARFSTLAILAYSAIFTAYVVYLVFMVPHHISQQTFANELLFMMTVPFMPLALCTLFLGIFWCTFQDSQVAES